MMNSTQIISAWLDLKLPINKTIGEKKYELMLKFFRKELDSFDIYYSSSNDSYFCLNSNQEDWVFVDRKFEGIFYYNRRYFKNYLFTIFGVLEDDEYHEYIIRRLIFDTKDILIKKYSDKFDSEHFNSLVYIYYIKNTLFVLEESIKMMIKDIKLAKSNEYGGFTES